MQNLSVEDIENVSGGWDWVFEFGPITVSGTGEEFAAGYDWCVSQMSDFFTWWDPAGYYGPVGC
jgi:hypothetical protein